MINITYKEFKGTNVDFLKPVVNALMVFQAESAKIHPEIMGSMNYDNRLKIEYKGSDDECMLVAYDNDEPVGFAYGTIGQVTQANFDKLPRIMEGLGGAGFYPAGYKVPKSIGTFKLLYVNEKYRGLSIGKKLSHDLMAWLKSKDIQDIWVYVANGNEKVGQFYEKYGFRFSHSVGDGFIDAYKQEI